MEDGIENSESVQFHSIDSEISFQRIKDLPKKSKYFGAHKRLSWICERDIQKFAKDAKLLTVEIERSQAFYKQKLKTLNDVKRNLRTSRNEKVRCKSCSDLEEEEETQFSSDIHDEACELLLNTEQDDKSEPHEAELKPPPQLMTRRFTMPALSKTLLVENTLKVQTDF